MKILIILGSPRKKGNTETLVETVLSTALEELEAEVEYIHLQSLKTLSPCLSCAACHKSGECIIKDDMIPLYDKVDTADILFLVTPVYFYGPSAQMKTFIDRFQARWSRKYLLQERLPEKHKRFGYLLSVGATKGRKVFDANILITKNFFDTVDFPYSGEILVRNKDAKGALEEDEVEMERARIFGKDVAARWRGEQ